MQIHRQAFEHALGQDDDDPELPPPLDSESTALLRGFLTPILESAVSWTNLRDTLAAKGFDMAFRSGRLVLIDANSQTPVCTGQMLGVPLRVLASRLGRPVIRVEPCGKRGTLDM